MTGRKFTPPTEYPTEYKTSHGQRAEILAKYDSADQPFAGVVHSADGDFTAAAWSDTGVFFVDGKGSSLDLHNIPKTKTVWVNVYPEDLVDFAYSSLDEASENANHDDRIACVKVTYAEGEGL